MKKKWIALMLALILILMCGCGADVEYDAPEQEQEQAVAEYPGTDLQIYDIDGNPVKLSDMVGKPVVLNFWATWCGPCKSELPEFQQAFETYGDQVQFVMVDLVEGREETVENGVAYIQECGYTFPLYFDSDQAALEAYQLSAVPASFFIDAEGNLVNKYVGAMSYEALDAHIQEII